MDSTATSGTLSAPGNGSYTFTENVSISPVILSGNNLLSCSIYPPLPPGLSLNSTTCTITGTPATGSSGASVYTVTGTLTGGGSTTIQITLTIQPQGVTSLTVTSPSGPWPHTFNTCGVYSIVFTAAGGAIATNGCTLESSPNLPSGWTLSRTSDTTCTISGVTSSTSPQTLYTVRASNPYGYAETTISFQVDDCP